MIPTNRSTSRRPNVLTITDLDDGSLWSIMTFIDPQELPRLACLFRKWHDIVISLFPVRIAFTSIAKWERWLRLPVAPNLNSLVIDHSRLRIYNPDGPLPRLIGFDQDFATTSSRFGSVISSNILRVANGFLPNWFSRTPLFSEHIMRCDTLTTLSISGMQCSDDQIEGICRLTRLRSLSLKSCYGKIINGHIFSTVRERKGPMKTRPMRSLINLTELRLDNCTLSHETIKDISKLSQLKILSLRGVPIDKMERQVLPLLSDLTELVELDLSDTGLWQCIESWPDQFFELEKLTTLFISRNAIRPGQLNKIAKIPNLTRLVMNVCTAPLIELVEMARLTDVDISGCCDLEYEKDETSTLDDEIVIKISRMDRLKRLILTDNETTSIGCKELIKMVNLTELDLSRTKIDKRCMEDLCAIKSLEILRLSETNISGIGYMKISGLTNLLTLDLMYTMTLETQGETQYVGDEQIKYIYESPSITELNIAGCRLTREGLELIARMPKLVKLDISGNSTPHNDISIIASMDRIEYLSMTLDMSNLLIVDSILEMESLTQVELQNEGIPMFDWEPHWNNKMRKIKLVTYYHRCVWLLRCDGGGEPRFVLVDSNGGAGSLMMRELQVINGDLFIIKEN